LCGQGDAKGALRDLDEAIRIDARSALAFALRAMANLSAILGYPVVQSFELVSDTESLAPPPADVDSLIADAFAKRPEILALEFEAESAEKIHRADRDQMYPTISALAAFGDSPVRDDRVYGPYSAVGVNLQIPVFNGFRYSAQSREAEIRAQAVRQRLADLRNAFREMCGQRG
jgi:outer membrane protein